MGMRMGMRQRVKAGWGEIRAGIRPTDLLVPSIGLGGREDRRRFAMGAVCELVGRLVVDWWMSDRVN